MLPDPTWVSGQLQKFLEIDYQHFRDGFADQSAFQTTETLAQAVAGGLLGLSRIDDSLRQSASDVVGPFAGDPSGLSDSLIQHMAQGPSVLLALQYHFARLACSRLLSGMQARGLFLIDLLRTYTLGDRASHFATRAAQSYIWGLFPECVIMSRAVLESALEHALYGQVEADKSKNLSALLRAASSRGLLKGLGGSVKELQGKPGTPFFLALEIKTAADHNVHVGPHSATQEDAERILSGLYHLLTILT